MPEPQYKVLEIGKLFVGKTNVRRAAGDITELTKSIEAKGVLQPILVRPARGKYEVVVGLRRYNASKAAGLKRVPAIVREMEDDEAIAASLVENVQRKDIEAEEEYDGLTALKRLNPKLYGTEEQLAKAINSSKSHVSDVMTAVQTVRSIRQHSRKEIRVRYQPTEEERKKGTAIPLVHGTLLHSAQESPTVQELPEKRRERGLADLATTIAPLPKDAATRVVDAWKRHPDKPPEELKQEVLAERTGQHLHVYIRPKVAVALERVAKERNLTMEEMVPIAVEEWLKQAGYFGG